jgi:hypothetical protein
MDLFSRQDRCPEWLGHCSRWFEWTQRFKLGCTEDDDLVDDSWEKVMR